MSKYVLGRLEDAIEVLFLKETPSATGTANYKVRVRNVTWKRPEPCGKTQTPHTYFDLYHDKTLKSAVLYRARTMFIYVSTLRIFKFPNPS